MASYGTTLHVLVAALCTLFLLAVVHAQNLPESEYPAPTAESYISYNATHINFRRCPNELKWKTTQSIELDCWCERSRQLGSRSSESPPFAPYCPKGIECRRTFEKLSRYASLDEAIESPFGKRVVLWQGNLAEGMVLPFVDAELRKPIYPYVDQLFIDALSKSAPFIADTGYKYDKCAVIGQSSILRGAGYGPMIDDPSYDAVFRMNENAIDKTEFHIDLGTKARYWMFSGQYSVAKLKEKGIMDRIRMSGATVIFLWNQATDYHKIIKIKREFPDVEIYALHPHYWWWWCAHRLNLFPDAEAGTWEEYFMSGFRLTSMTGTVMSMMALQSCRTVHLFGFYGLVHAPDGRVLEHHFDAADREKRENLSVRLDLEMLMGLSTLSQRSADPKEARELRIFI